jgi:acetate kinase
MKILALNAGSSSLKLALFEIDERREERTLRSAVDHSGDVAGALRDATVDLAPPEAVGHRFVHGGPDHSAPVRVDTDLRHSFESLVRFAPLHLPAELALLDAAASRWPEAAQVACFDTAFHRGLPEVAQRLALPRALFDDGVRRYGFHGLSYEYVVEAIGAEKLGRAVIAHLGNGASMVAVRDGRSVDTTMGLTPTGGLMMGTRVGDLDPGVLVHLMDRDHLGPRELEALLNEQSGLLGVSGLTNNMKTLLEACADDPNAELAVEMFCYTARKFVGALAAALGGLDTLVFTGGIGEHAAPVRERICAGLRHLGVDVDPARNAAAASCISRESGACRVLVVATDEERIIARHTFRVLA